MVIHRKYDELAIYTHIFGKLIVYKVEWMHNLSYVSDAKIMTQKTVKGKYVILWNRKYKNFFTSFAL